MFIHPLKLNGGKGGELYIRQADEQMRLQTEIFDTAHRCVPVNSARSHSEKHTMDCPLRYLCAPSAGLSQRAVPLMQWTVPLMQVL